MPRSYHSPIPRSAIFGTVILIGVALYYDLKVLAALAIFLPVISYGWADYQLRRQRDLLTPKGPWSKAP